MPISQKHDSPGVTILGKLQHFLSRNPIRQKKPSPWEKGMSLWTSMYVILWCFRHRYIPGYIQKVLAYDCCFAYVQFCYIPRRSYYRDDWYPLLSKSKIRLVAFAWRNNKKTILKIKIRYLPKKTEILGWRHFLRSAYWIYYTQLH